MGQWETMRIHGQWYGGNSVLGWLLMEYQEAICINILLITFCREKLEAI